MRGDAILLVVMAVLPPGQALLADATRLKAPFPPTSSAPARRRQQPMTMMAPRFASREDMFVMIYADTYAVLYAQGTRTGFLRTVRTRGIGQLAAVDEQPAALPVCNQVPHAAVGTQCRLKSRAHDNNLRTVAPQAMMKQLNKDGAGEWSTPLPPREKSPERETTPEQIRADAKCVFAVHPNPNPNPNPNPKPEPNP